ncbi:MAG: GNAT family N-acetyltransferase [Chloroflexota bacterium]
MTAITLRPATNDDRTAVLQVEKKAMPAMQYLPRVYEMFLNDPQGEFTVAEIDSEVVACAKFSVLPDGSGWLETIRVTPERQGLGVGKRFYENYYAIAKRDGVPAMRMYTGINNAVSAGLAARYRLTRAETFYGFTLSTDQKAAASNAKFMPVTDPDYAVDLIMPHASNWGHYLVMNRTFYQLTPALCQHLAQRGFVFHGDAGTVVAGARFMPHAALHVGFFAGDAQQCLQFAANQASTHRNPQIHCLFAITSNGVKPALEAAHYQETPSQFIVMEVQV